jgi:uncharacterized protein (TIGR02421 family)
MSEPAPTPAAARADPADTGGAPAPEDASPAERLRAGQRVRLSLPGGGELQIDRPLPFLFAYDPPGKLADPHTSRLLRAEASVWIPSRTLPREEMRRILIPILEALRDAYGAVLVIEIRALPRSRADEEENRFLIGTHPSSPEPEVLRTLEDELRKVRVRQRDAVVETRVYRRPPGAFAETVGRRKLEELGVEVVQLGVPPVYRDEEDELYPLVLRSLRRQLARVLRRTAHRFAVRRTTRSPASYLALGRQRLVQAVLAVDRRLEEIVAGFDDLLLITPSNVEPAWRKFQEDRFEVAPRFQYRPIPIDPVLQKRRLYELPIERISDPALAEIYEHRRTELDVRLGLLLARGTRWHLLGGQQLYGEIDKKTWATAERLLALPARGEHPPHEVIDGEAFARRAREELRHYRRSDRSFRCEVKVRGDLGSVLVSRGQLYVDRWLQLPAYRLEALIQHEIGTHVLTHHNGRRQPLAIFASGLAGYEELQEGLAVLAEHLAGGLSVARLRLLAGRVAAARAKLDDATFVETWRLLHDRHGFSGRTAFLTTMRAYRGGGSLKDVIYLRGVARLLEHLRGGGALEPLYVGKIALGHVALVRELLEREILLPPALLPRILGDPAASARLARLRAGVEVEQIPAEPGSGEARDA